MAEEVNRNIKRTSELINNNKVDKSFLKNINLQITDGEIKLHLKIIEALYPNMKLKVDKLINGSYNIFTKFLVQSHIDDFNSFINVYIKNIAENIPIMEFSPQQNNYSLLNMNKNNSESVKFFVSDIQIKNPMIKNDKGEYRADYPYLCKLSARTYEGELLIKINRQYKDEIASTTICAGHIPIMIMSNLCNLSNLNKKELAQKGEDQSLLGGFFVVSGRLKVIRYVIHPKYNTLLLNADNKIHINCLLNDNTVVINFLTLTRNNSYVYGFRFQNAVCSLPFHLLLMILSPIKKKSYIFNKIKLGVENENAIKYIELFINSIFLKDTFNEKELFEKYNLSYLGRIAYLRRGIFKYNLNCYEKKSKRYFKILYITTYKK